MKLLLFDRGKDITITECTVIHYQGMIASFPSLPFNFRLKIFHGYGVIVY